VGTYYVVVAGLRILRALGSSHFMYGSLPAFWDRRECMREARESACFVFVRLRLRRRQTLNALEIVAQTVCKDQSC
jgi:hypothetical protein